MSMNFDIIALGSFAAAITAIATISFAVFRLMFNSHTRNADVAKAKQDADTSAKFQALDDRVRDSENAITRLNTTHESHRDSLDDTVKRIIRIEIIQEQITSSLNKMEAKLDNQNDQLLELVRILKSK